MRYMNWDVLMFPETGDTKTPLQEFATSCSVVQDLALDNITASNSGKSGLFKTVTHPLPTVSCFVPSLLPGSPLRISLHSWATPVASRATQSMAAQNSPVSFEAKLLLDGVCTAGVLFSQDSSWPQVINTNHSVDKEGKHEPIGFPPFHQELLTQVWANPAQGMGTVRIVIAEGINEGQGGSASFTRLRNIVTFSFQHAPLHILENCGIAWPNPGMWWQAQQQFYNHTTLPMEPADPEAHAHSPRRPQTSRQVSTSRPENTPVPSHTSQGLIAHPAFRALTQGNDPFWSQHGPMHDPFTGSATANGFYKTVASRFATGSDVTTVPSQSRSTSTSHDEMMPDYSRTQSSGSSFRSFPMPDYSRSLSPASSRPSHHLPNDSCPPTLPSSRQASQVHHPAMNEFDLSESIGQSFQDHQINHPESQFEEYMALRSPRKSSTMSGISAPSNTRVNSATNTPRLNSSGMSAAAQERASSHPDHPRSVSVTTRDPPPPGNQVTCSSTKSSSNYPLKRSPNVGNEVAEAKPKSDTVIKKKPIGRPKGRKEGKSSDILAAHESDNKVNRRATTGTIGALGKENEDRSTENLSDGKRKRAIDNAGSKITLGDRLANRDELSPTRKVSRTQSAAVISKVLVAMPDSTEEAVRTRSPLGEIENRL